MALVKDSTPEAESKKDKKDKKVKERHSVRRINRIAEVVAARSYLEVGVSKGKTFNALDFPRKVAVDPEFRFAVEEFRKPGVDFFEITSDAYFTQHELEKFDIIFLDGLHVFQQTFRDFCNSLCFAHDRTVWLVDDVMPSDAFSAIPDQAECLRRRHEAGDPSNKWHGDIYKVMFAIHDFFPTFSYVSMNTDGNGQAIVWMTPRRDFAPALGTLTAVEALSYSELLAREAVLNLQGEEEAFATFSASFAAKTAASAERPSGIEDHGIGSLIRKSSIGSWLRG